VTLCGSSVGGSPPSSLPQLQRDWWTALTYAGMIRDQPKWLKLTTRAAVMHRVDLTSLVPPLRSHPGGSSGQKARNTLLKPFAGASAVTLYALLLCYD
jgi:hypothetical protein